MSGHPSKVRVLYKGILKLHRGMPHELRAIGDRYVKEEFRTHKGVSAEEGATFLEEWTRYYMTLASQVGSRAPKSNFGEYMTEDLLKHLREEQVEQLYDLLKETQKPVHKDE